MVLPNKYVKYEDSYIYYSALLLKLVDGKQHEQLFELVKDEMSYDIFTTALLLLYSLGLIEMGEGGYLYEKNQ